MKQPCTKKIKRMQIRHLSQRETTVASCLTRDYIRIICECFHRACATESPFHRACPTAISQLVPNSFLHNKFETDFPFFQAITLECARLSLTGQNARVSHFFFNFFSCMAASNSLFFASSTFTCAPCFSAKQTEFHPAASLWQCPVPSLSSTVSPSYSASALLPFLAKLLPPQTKLLLLQPGRLCLWHYWLES